MQSKKDQPTVSTRKPANLSRSDGSARSQPTICVRISMISDVPCKRSPFSVDHPDSAKRHWPIRLPDMPDMRFVRSTPRTIAVRKRFERPWRMERKCNLCSARTKNPIASYLVIICFFNIHSKILINKYCRRNRRRTTAHDRFLDQVHQRQCHGKGTEESELKG